MIVMAFGLGFIFVPITLTAVSGVEPRDSGIASAMLNVTQQLGGTIGLAALVTVFSAALTSFITKAVAGLVPAQRQRPAVGQIRLDGLAHGWATGFRAAVVFAAIALVAAIVGVKAEPMDPQAQGSAQAVPAT